MKPGDEVELDNHRAMIEIPENTVELEIIAKVYYDGKIIEVAKFLGMVEVREACRKADEGYIDDDDKFYIAEKGEQFLKELAEKYK